MKDSRITFDESTFRILYYRYKEFILPFLIIIICLGLFLKIVIPQFQDWFLMQEEEKKISKKITVLRSNINFLSNMDASSLESEFKIASLALPFEKDFIGVINAVAVASAKSGVKVNDFSFQVGNLSIDPKQSGKKPSLSISLAVNGGINGARQFLKVLAEMIPISEITNVNLTDSTSNISIVFYYKPIPSINLNYDLPIKPLSKEEKTTLEEISKWQVFQSNSN